MQNKETAKGTVVFEMFRELWELHKRFFVKEYSEEYWDALIDAQIEFTEKYKSAYARDLMLSFLSEIERRYENEKM